MQAISDNPVSMASYASMQRAGGDLQFNFNLGVRFDAIGQTNPAARLIQLYPAAISAEAKRLGYAPLTYAARVFTHEVDHLMDMHRGVWQNTRYAEFQAYKMESLFQNWTRPSLDARRMIWHEVGEDYPHLPVGKNPFGGLRAQRSAGTLCLLNNDQH
ncbi:hypothetical protein GCM10007907_30310 [Chitinimonas prasina]|uniref:Uncharacterized protein n=1 Tax=Chitinimonas prasina TaxID=1434937 RepID=A0ABQ5YGW6_9NEIS|nr:hypothetical protein [Chitinimonas prasina]GLR14241.1 hypothetical protein GCM10007907_30310 [Chitinimonas prasina]